MKKQLVNDWRIIFVRNTKKFNRKNFELFGDLADIFIWTHLQKKKRLTRETILQSQLVEKDPGVEYLFYDNLPYRSRREQNMKISEASEAS